MTRTIIFYDGILFDNGWNAIDPTDEELQAIDETLKKYQSLKKTSK